MAYTIPPGETDIVGTLTRILADIDVRLKRAQEAADTLPAAEREFRANALKRISADLAPMVDTLRARIQRGVLTATSDTEVLLIGGIERTWVVAEADRTTFAPSPYVLALRRLSMADTALLRVTGWDPASGAFTAEVLEITGNPGPHTDWEFVSGPGVVTAQRAWIAEGRSERALTVAARQSAQDAAAQVASDKLVVGMSKSGAEQAAATATSKAAEAVAAADRAKTWDPTNYYAKAAVDQKLTDAATATDGKIAALKGSADADHDTLGEIAADLASVKAAVSNQLDPIVAAIIFGG